MALTHVPYPVCASGNHIRTPLTEPALPLLHTLIKQRKFKLQAIGPPHSTTHCPDLVIKLGVKRSGRIGRAQASRT